LKNKFAPVFFLFNQRWQWPALVGEFLHQPLLAAFGLPVISLSPAFTSAGLQILSSLAAYGLPVLFMQPALQRWLAKPALVIYIFHLHWQPTGCQFHHQRWLAKPALVPLCWQPTGCQYHHIYIYKQIFQIHSLFLQRKSSAIYFRFLIDFPITQHEMALIPLVRSSIS
jgi:hypothetical protein